MADLGLAKDFRPSAITPCCILLLSNLRGKSMIYHTNLSWGKPLLISYIFRLAEPYLAFET